MRIQSGTQVPTVFPKGLIRLGAPGGSVPTSLTIISGESQSVLAGTNIGLFRSVGSMGSKDFKWVRLCAAPTDILVVAASPNFDKDGVLLVGTSNGIYCSDDRGSNWSPARLPRTNLSVISIRVSPNFASDGIVVAGTLSDGILYSDSRGKSWTGRNFGLEEGAVLEIAFSPEFTDDTTLFAATDKSLYYSYNGALAWKHLDFPEEASPILGLAILPGFGHKRTIYAGTENSGLFLSIDFGGHWSAVDLPALCINSLLSTPAGLLAATEIGIFETSYLSDTWKCVLGVSSVLNLCHSAGLFCASTSGGGIWMADEQSLWHPLPEVADRSVTGVAIAPQTQCASEVLMFGPAKGLWWSNDGGCAWANIGGELPSHGVSDLAISPRYANNRLVVVATPSGVLISNDGCRRWTVSLLGCADLTAFSENGEYLAANLGVDGIYISADLGNTWVKVLVPWDSNSKVLSLAVSNTGQLYIACFITATGILQIWKGISGQFKLVLKHQQYENHKVCLYTPVFQSRHWYASVGNLVLKFDPLTDNHVISTVVFEVEAHEENIICMVGIDSAEGLVLLVNTGKYIYRSVDADEWGVAYDFGDYRCISLTHSSNYSIGDPVFALMVGGLLFKGVLTLS